MPAVPIGVTRKGDASPGDRRQEARASKGPEAGSSADCGRPTRPETARADGRSGPEGASRKDRPEGRREPDRGAGGTGASPGSRRRCECRLVPPWGWRTSIKNAGVEGPRPEPRSRELRTGQSWKGLEASAVSRKRSSDTSTRRGGASLLSFFVREKAARRTHPARPRRPPHPQPEPRADAPVRLRMPAFHTTMTPSP